ncbi:GNAT family N-acetyltransferase [Neptunicoccus cionae]|uniref:GNAT family N-acetyltransferase n=1 Tax=Neptunicoccus cionae TaxID=2035344 RepID=UPI000C75EFE4|nr:GNAT family N-acetyltransferase [Amylibacter cionae]PLS20424.1 GNAT family N-acetyltransferase [Amylibacter cionae]
MLSTPQTIRLVEKSDLPLLNTALAALSTELGDPHPATPEFLEQAGFGPLPAYYALIAQSGPDALEGAIMFSPVTSTSIASTGTFVSDLWVAESTRGSGLGRRLLEAAARWSSAQWGAGYIKLVVYDQSVQSRRFYDRLGFVPKNGETTMFLDNNGFKTLKGCK